MVEILLRSNIPNLGRIGDIVEVRPGYARNYLFPHDLAVPVTENNSRMVEKQRRKHLAEEEARVEEASRRAERLAGLSLEISVKTNEEGHLYGSVTPRMIAEALVSRGFEVPVSAVRLKHNIEEVGMHEVPVHLHTDVEAVLQIKVVPG